MKIRLKKKKIMYLKNAYHNSFFTKQFLKKVFYFPNHLKIKKNPIFSKK